MMEDTLNNISTQNNESKALRTEEKLLKLLQDKYKGFHPAIILAELAQKVALDDNLRIQAAKALLPYVAPQLKSIEISGNIKHDFGLLRVSLDKDVIDITPDKDNPLDNSGDDFKYNPLEEINEMGTTPNIFAIGDE